MSTPARSRDTAHVCRKTWGESCLPCKLGHTWRARATYLARRCSTASGLSWLPRLVGNSGSSGAPRRSSLSMAPQMRARAEGEVSAAQPGQLGDSQPGLDGDREQGVVPAADPARPIGAGEQGVDLSLGEERDKGPAGALRRDGQHPGDELGVLRVAEGGEAEQ